MTRTIYIATAAWLTLTAALGAQTTAPRFQWRTGQTLDYKVEQSTSVTDTMEDKTSETGSKLSTVRHWQVQDVDARGVATVQLSLSSLRIETKSPNGDVLTFDSSQPDKGTPEMKKQMGQYVGVPLGVLRVNPLGRVVEVKQCNFGPGSRYECEPPFGVVFADDMANGLWQRAYQVTLEPPQGTGEKFNATQKYSIKSQEGGKLVVGFSTDITMPAAVADQIPLLQWQPQGEIVFDAQSGATQSVRFAIDKELKGHQGPGSTYRFQTTYQEEMVTTPGR
jgi:hypothetical protein